MHTLVHLVVALAAISLVLMALLGLRTTDSSIEDESSSQSDPGGHRERSVDLTVIYQSTLILPKKRVAATRTRLRRPS